MLARMSVPEPASRDRSELSPSDARRADAFRLLADVHLDDSYRLANAVLGSPTEARDAVHDAFVTGWQRWPSLRDPDKFGAWFKRIVVNVCRDQLRRAARVAVTSVSTPPRVSISDASDAVHAKVLIEEGLALLKPDDRLILALRYYRDLKIDDIADLLDIPPGTATSRLRTAHTRLRQVIERPESRR